MVIFRWYPGLAKSQKQKSIQSLHQAAKMQLQVDEVLEISSKSPSAAGVAASAFSLKIRLPDGWVTTVECAYQGSKAFGGLGPYRDLYRGTSLQAKRDERLHLGDVRLTAFDFFGELWPLAPSSLFYDWLYVNAMTQPQNESLLHSVLKFGAYTDIEFNPEKSVSCQAASVALLRGLTLAGCELETIAVPETFRSLYGGDTERRAGDGMLL